MIFQEPMTSLNPVLTIGEQIAESVRLHLELDRKAAHARMRSACWNWSRSRCRGAARERISAPALGRHAPARDDRAGDGLQPDPADRRRADHRARRHDPGPDPGADGPAAEGDRHEHAVRHPQSRRGRAVRRRGRGDVCRADRRIGAGARPVRPARASLHARPAGLPAGRGAAARHAGAGRQASALVAIPGQVSSPFAPPPGCAFAPRCSHRREACDARMPGLDTTGGERMVRCIGFTEELAA